MGYVVELDPSLGPALVVGGGTIAGRKVRGLVAAGFRVTVVAPEISEEIIAEPQVSPLRREFAPGDIGGHVLVFACTDRREVNEATGRAARDAGVPVVVSDRQDEGTARTPATYRDGPLTIAVSTGGGAPRVAADIRDEIAAALGADAGARIAAAANARRGRHEPAGDDD